MKVKVLKKLVSLFSEWNKKNIRYCHWKSNEHLYEALIAKTDLDILVDFKQKNMAEQVLEQNKFINMTSQYGSRYPFVSDWLGCDEEKGELIHIHLHYKIITGHTGLKEYILPFTEDVLESRIVDKSYSVYTAEPNMEFVILYTRIGLKAGINKIFFSEHDIREIQYLKRNISWIRVKDILSKYYKSESRIMLYLMKDDSYSADIYISLHKVTKKTFKKYRRTGFVTFVLRIWYVGILFLRLAARKVLFHDLIVQKTFGKDKGIMIAFVGQDGAGKSTVTEEILDWLSWKIDARKFYLGSGEHYRSWQKKCLEILAHKNGNIARTIRGIITLSNLIRLSRHNYHTICRGKNFSCKGGITIFDRFPQVEFEGINDGPQINKLIEKFNGKLVREFLTICADYEMKYFMKAIKNNPDIVFKLLLPVDESLRRKPEEDEQTVRIKHDIIERLSYKETKVVCIDATMSMEDEKVLIHNEIWNFLWERC